MPEGRKCATCGADFVVSDDDKAFIQKVSPEYGGKKLELPLPNKCPECRRLEHLIWRNERCIYKTKSEKGKDIVSIYAPNSGYKVYSQDEFYSDDWDATEYGQEFDFDRPFFEQYNELIKNTPCLSRRVVEVENSDYVSNCWHVKNCYLLYNAGYDEDCLYSTQLFYSKNCSDCFDVKNSERLYGSTDCDNCQNSSYLHHCKNTYESHFCYDCSDCKNVIMSTNLRHKQYYIRNKEYTKDEYFAKLEELGFGRRSNTDKLYNEFIEIKKAAIHKENNNVKTEDSLGDYLVECKGCYYCFNGFRSENCHYTYDVDDAGKDTRYADYIAECELCYDGLSVSGYKNILGCFSVGGRTNVYCNTCMNCENCFGCTMLRDKKFCILNKQYSEEEYNQLMPKIYEHMKSTEEWGRFMPPSISPFGYNETVAGDYYPKSKEEAQKLGAKWQDEDFGLKYDGPFYEPENDINSYKDESKQQELLSGIIRCEVTGKPFRVVPQELAFYIENNIPVPTKHSEARFKELFNLRNPRKLYHRQCMCEESGHDHEGRCKNEFETTYAPDRPEKVYCESCYQKSVI